MLKQYINNTARAEQKLSLSSSAFNSAKTINFCRLALAVGVLIATPMTWATSADTQTAANSSPSASNPARSVVAAQQSLSLPQAIDRVKAYQAQQGVWATQQRIADANAKQSKLWANPSVDLERSGFKSDQDQEWSVGLSQSLDVFGTRRANQELAKLSRSQTDLNQRIYTAQIDLVVKYLWSQLAIFELERSVAQEQLQVSQENLDALEKRYKAGSVALVDVDRVRMTYQETVRLYHQADLQRQVAMQQLSNLWGEADKNIQVALSASAYWPSSTPQQVQTYLSQNLAEQSRQLNVLTSKANIQYLKAKGRPNPTVNMTMTNTKKPNNETENKMAVGLSIPLNIFDRNQYGVQIAQEKADLLNRQQALYMKQNALEIGSLITNLQGLELQYKQVDEVQMPLAINVQKKTLQGFNAGKFAVTDVQQATLQLQDIRMRKVQLLKDAWQSAIQAESLSLGIAPSQIMSADALSQINQSIWQDTQNLPVIGGNN